MAGDFGSFDPHLVDEATRNAVAAASAGPGRDAFGERDVAHVAPEVLNGEFPSERSAVYTVASHLFADVVGRPAHEPAPGEDERVFGARINLEPLADLRSLGVPKSLVPVMTAALSKNPSGRHPSLDHLVDDLQRSRAALRLPPAPIAHDRRGTDDLMIEPQGSERRARLRLSVLARGTGVLAVALALIGLLTWEPAGRRAGTTQLARPADEADAPELLDRGLSSSPGPSMVTRGRNRVGRVAAERQRVRVAVNAPAVSGTTSIAPHAGIAPGRRAGTAPAADPGRGSRAPGSRGGDGGSVDRRTRPGEDVQEPPTATIYHLWNPDTYDHYYAISRAEVRRKVAQGYSEATTEGRIFLEKQPGMDPFHPDNASEPLGYMYHFIRKGTTALFHLEGPEGEGDFYTTSNWQRERAIRRGWADYGTAGYVLVD